MNLVHTWIQESVLSLESHIVKCRDVNWESNVEAEIKVHRNHYLEQPTTFLSKTAVSDRDTTRQMWAEADWVS